MQGARVDREDRITPASMVLLDVYIFDVAQNRTARANSDIKCEGDCWASTICLKQTIIQSLITPTALFRLCMRPVSGLKRDALFTVAGAVLAFNECSLN